MANVGDIGLLAQYIITTADQLHQQLKLVKRRLPVHTSISNLGLSKEVSDNFYQCFQHSGRVMKTLYEVVKISVQFISACGGKYFTLHLSHKIDIVNIICNQGIKTISFGLLINKKMKKVS